MKRPTPETDAMVAADQHHIDDDNWITMSCYWRMSDLARTLEHERDMARAAANSFRQCAEITFGPMPFPRKFHWETNEPMTTPNKQEQ